MSDFFRYIFRKDKKKFKNLTNIEGKMWFVFDVCCISAAEDIFTAAV